MPRLLKGLRKRGDTIFYRIRSNGQDHTINLGSDLDLAVTQALRIRKRLENGLPPVEEPQPQKPVFTLRDAVNSWLEDVVSVTRHHRFAEATRARAEKVLLPFEGIGDLPLSEITAQMLFKYRTHVKSRPNKPSIATIRMYLGDARAAINYALETDMLDRSPVPRRWLPKKPKHAPDVLTREEQAILKALPGDHGRVLRFMLASGVRWQEAVRALAQDIQGTKLVVKKSKSGEIRRVPLPADVLAECQGRVGRLCPFKCDWKFNRRIKRISGITRFTTRITRHTFATEWRDAGGSLAGLQVVLGHSSVKTTEMYGTITDDLVEREASRLEQYRAQLDGTKNGTIPKTPKLNPLQHTG